MVTIEFVDYLAAFSEFSRTGRTPEGYIKTMMYYLTRKDTTGQERNPEILNFLLTFFEIDTNIPPDSTCALVIFGLLVYRTLVRSMSGKIPRVGEFTGYIIQIQLEKYVADGHIVHRSNLHNMRHLRCLRDKFACHIGCTDEHMFGYLILVGIAIYEMIILQLSLDTMGTEFAYKN